MGNFLEAEIYSNSTKNGTFAPKITKQPQSGSGWFIVPQEYSIHLAFHAAIYHSGWDSSESRQPGLFYSSKFHQAAVMRKGRGKS